MKCIIYLIENIKNNKKYVGATTSEDGFKSRYRSGKGEGIERVLGHFEYFKNRNEFYNIHLYRSILKYGVESFIVHEEFDVANTIEELCEKEKYWIKYFSSTVNGYNVSEGGIGNKGWSKNRYSLNKRRTSKASIQNKLIEKWTKERMHWENPFLNIWKFDDGLITETKEVMFYLLLGGKCKECDICKIKTTNKRICARCDDNYTPMLVVKKERSNKRGKYKKRKKYEPSVELKEFLHKNKKEIIKYYINDEYSITKIVSILNIKSLTYKLLKSTLKSWGIKIVSHKNSNVNNFPEIFISVSDNENNIIKVFNHKSYVRKWVRDNSIGDLYSSRLDALLKSNESYNGFIFRIIDEDIYRKFS